jgi:hypothetical protein
VNADLDTLATALCVTIDDALINHPEWVPERAEVGIVPKLSDAELLTLAVLQSLLGYTSEARFIRYAHTHLKSLFPYICDRSGCNKRLRAGTATMRHVTAMLGRSCPSFDDDIWLIDSTPVECGRSRQTVKRSDLAGWAIYGYCSSHSRRFWGLRLHLIATPSGLPISFALTAANHDERQVRVDMISADPNLARSGQILIADKGYRSARFEAEPTDAGITLIRPTIRGEKPRPLQRFLRPFRQIIESVNQTLKAQPDLERRGARRPPGVTARICQRLLALTAAIWHNDTTKHPGSARSLTAYDHQPLGTNHLDRPENLDRCLKAMLERGRIRFLDPQPERPRIAVLKGEPIYARPFTFRLERYARLLEKPRAADKSLDSEQSGDMTSIRR